MDVSGLPAWFGSIVALCALAANSAAAQPIELKPGATPGLTMHRSNIRNQAYCEIIPILGMPPNDVAHVYTTAPPGDDCPQDKLQSIDAKALASELGAESVAIDPTPQSARRYWVADEIWNFTVGETVDFHGVRATWRASVPPDLVRGAVAAPYTPAETRGQSMYVYSKGAKVFLMRAPDGKTWVMQSYATEVDNELSFDRLSELDSALKMPDGYRYEVIALRQTLTIDPRKAGGLAHLMRDELHDVYLGCGFDAACSFNPGGAVSPPRRRPRRRRH